MEYKMIVRRTLFDFDLTPKGRVKLRSVRFLNDSVMKKQNDLLLLKENESVQFFLDQKTPVSHLSQKQFRFVSAAAKYFGHFTDQEQLPVWLWAGSLDVPAKSTGPAKNVVFQQSVAARC